jgi:transcriptional regulator with XRE-family HTH domain
MSELQDLPFNAVMEGMDLPKKLEILLAPYGTAARISRVTGIPSSRFADWKNPDSGRKPTLEDALLVARALGVSLDYLADDAQDEPPSVLTEQEKLVLEAYRESGLSPYRAVKAMQEAAEVREDEPIRGHPPVDLPSPIRAKGHRKRAK